jgi:small conductance mechanosensitive channel
MFAPRTTRYATVTVSLVIGATAWAAAPADAPAADVAAANAPAAAAPVDAPVAAPAPAAPVDTPAAKPVATDLAALPAAQREAAESWIRAVGATPRLVTLAHDAPADASAADALRNRLQVLGDKTFSNREWRAYWERQGKLAGALATQLPEGTPARADLAAWSKLAAAKVENQDRYLNAIETERDAIEDRLEALLDASGETRKAEAPDDRDAMTPYERRRAALTDLARRIEQQKQKRLTAVGDRTLIERQIEASDVLATALRRDVELAREERRIASAAGARQVVWAETWRSLASSSATKTDKLDHEAQAESARGRARRVEASLLRSQASYREQRITELEAERDKLDGFGEWMRATRATLVEWATSRAWRILLGLLLIGLAVRLLLRVVDRLLAMWVRRAEGDPDDTSDDDTRALTLANVFSGVTRPAVYGVAALLALETIGVNTGPLLGSVAILGLAVSFGSQNLVRDVVNGFFILLEHQYAVGEFVEIGGKSGTVERITIRSTWIRQGNGDIHVVPNGSITVVSNMTRDWSRAVVHVGVAYDADLARVREVCDEVGRAMKEDDAWKDVLEEAPAWVGVTELADSAVVVRVAGKIRAGQQWAAQRELNQRLKLAFDAAGIEIPFPQRVVWTKPA